MDSGAVLLLSRAQILDGFRRLAFNSTGIRSVTYVVWKYRHSFPFRNHTTLCDVHLSNALLHLYTMLDADRRRATRGARTTPRGSYIYPTHILHLAKRPLAASYCYTLHIQSGLSNERHLHCRDYGMSNKFKLRSIIFHSS